MYKRFLEMASRSAAPFRLMAEAGRTGDFCLTQNRLELLFRALAGVFVCFPAECTLTRRLPTRGKRQAISLGAVNPWFLAPNPRRADQASATRDQDQAIRPAFPLPFRERAAECRDGMAL